MLYVIRIRVPSLGYFAIYDYFIIIYKITKFAKRSNSMTLCAFSFLSQTMNLLNVNSPMSTDQSLAGNRLLKFEIISNRNSNNYYYYFDQKRYFNPNVIQCNAKPVCFSVAPTFENVTKSLSQTAARMFNVNYVNIKMFIKIRLTYLFLWLAMV